MSKSSKAVRLTSDFNGMCSVKFGTFKNSAMQLDVMMFKELLSVCYFSFSLSSLSLLSLYSLEYPYVVKYR